MKVRTNVLAWIGIVLAVLGMGVVLVSSISKWFVLIPVVVLVAALVALLKGVTFGGIGKVRWALVAAWALVAIFAICTVLVAVFFGWLALLPFVLLCGAVTWLVYILKKTAIWIPIIALVIAIILLGVYCIMGSFMRDWSAAIDTLTVKNLIVENEEVINQDVENQDVENQDVENQDVENQEVTNQKVDKSEVKDQKVENQEVQNQKVENQEVKNQKVENQKVENQNKEDQKGGSDEGKKEEDTGKKEEAHKHSYTSKVVAPTCTEKGYTVYTCACGDTYKDAYKNALGHKYTTKVVAPTCTEKGYTVYTCACGHSYKGDYKNALGHSYTSKVVAPTTTAQGYTLHTCKNCGHSYKDNYTAKLEPEVTPTIKCAKTIRYGETLYVNLEGIKASNLLVSNKNFVAVETISDSRVAITLTEDVDGYLTITDSVSRVNVVIDIVEG